VKIPALVLSVAEHAGPTLKTPALHWSRVKNQWTNGMWAYPGRITRHVSSRAI